METEVQCPYCGAHQGQWADELARTERSIAEIKAELFKALAHPIRIRVLELLADGERSVGELLSHLGLEASHLSQQRFPKA